MNEETTYLIIEGVFSLLGLMLTIGLPLLFKWLHKKYRVEISESRQRQIMEASRRAVEFVEEEAHRRASGGQDMESEEKHDLAMEKARKSCVRLDLPCSEDEIDEAVSAAVYETRHTLEEE